MADFTFQVLDVDPRPLVTAYLDDIEDRLFCSSLRGVDPDDVARLVRMARAAAEQGAAPAMFAAMGEEVSRG